MTLKIRKSPININGVDIDKMFISAKFGFGKKGCKYFMARKNNKDNFFLVYENSKNE